MTNNDTMPTFAVQPAAWGKFDSYGCDYAINITHAYNICKQWRAMGTPEDMMIFRMTAGDGPIAWVRVYADETIDAADPALNHLV